MLANLGLENLADLAAQLPQFGALPNATRTTSLFGGPAATGLNGASLRNLGPGRTLVLVNGRRAPAGTAAGPVADFNAIPTANVERVEVITGGASAVYGSEAVAGVINIITRKRFEGFEVGVGYGQAERGDNRNPTGHVLWGKTFGTQGRLMATLQLDRQGQVRCRDRELCSENFSWTTPTNPLRGAAANSATAPGGRFFVGANSYTRRDGSFVDASGRLIPFSLPIDGYNANAERDLAIPTARTLAALEGQWSVTPSISVIGELNHARIRSESHYDPHAFQSNNPNSLFGALEPTIPITHPFIPAPLRAAIDNFNATAPANARITQLTWHQRFSDLGGPRSDVAVRESTRAVLGLKGDVNLVGHDWRWDLYHLQSTTQVQLARRGQVSTSNLYHGLRLEEDPATPGAFRCVDAAARAAGCVPVNPFADYTPQQREALRTTGHADGRSVLSNTVASIAGTPLDLPAGALQIAAGLERRTFSGYYDQDVATNQGFVSAGRIDDQAKATTSTNEFFVEALVPVLANRPGVQALNVETAYRRSETARYGYDTWKVGGDWQPAGGLRVRAMRARSVIAPPPALLSGESVIVGALTDPCTAARRNQNLMRAANCAADGIPSDYAPPSSVEQFVSGRAGGNPDLRPEVGTTLTYGLVWEPKAIAGLTLAVDRFKIDVRGLIGSVARQTAVNTCYDTAERALCPALTRGAHPLMPGANHVLTAVDARLGNLAANTISGVDVDLKYGWKMSGGTLDGGLLLTWYDKATLTPLPGGSRLNLLGQAGSATNGGSTGWIKTTAVVNLGWRRGAFAVNWNMRYIGTADMGLGTTESGYPRLGEHRYHHLRLGYRFGKGSEVSFGINNLFDKQPPFFATGSSGTPQLDTVPGYYDVFGRSYFASLRTRF